MGLVKVVYTGIDQPNGLVMDLPESKAMVMLGSPQYRLHESVDPVVAQRLLPPPLTPDERFNYLIRRYFSLCNCLNKKGERDALRAELHALKAERQLTVNADVPT